MTRKSNDNGRSFEFACMMELKQQIELHRKVSIIKNQYFYDVEKTFHDNSEDFQKSLLKSAKVAVEVIFELEPLIIEDGTDELELAFQSDHAGEEGDVRDILIVRRHLKWEIGLSLKHNHTAAKHPRLSASLDFGKKWYNIPCSYEYWKKVIPVFDYLKDEKCKGTLWSELPNKEEDVYVPLLEAFKAELERAYQEDPTLPKRLVSYILGKYDFYKVISFESKKEVDVLPFNLRGSLNQRDHSETEHRKRILEISRLPTEIVVIKYKSNSRNTLELYMNNGWQFSFRIHNAEHAVKASLKFDVQIEGMPTTIMSIHRKWN